MIGDPLTEAISQAARELPAPQALRLADELAGCPEPEVATRAGIHRLVPTAAFERAGPPAG